MSISRRAFLGIATAGSLARFRVHSSVSSGASDGQARAYTLVPDGAGRTLEDPDGRVVLTYLVAKPEGSLLAGNSACCIHPFNTPGGVTATDFAPQDHRDHRGIFFAWHDMTFAREGETLRGDFWGWGRFAPVEGRTIVNRDVRLSAAGATSGEM